MKTGLVLEGGAMRGMFTAGVLDVLMENGITVDGAIGVSAGAVFGCNYKSHQIGRTIRYNTQYCNDKRYASFKNLLRTEPRCRQIRPHLRRHAAGTFPLLRCGSHSRRDLHLWRTFYCELVREQSFRGDLLFRHAVPDDRKLVLSPARHDLFIPQCLTGPGSGTDPHALWCRRARLPLRRHRSHSGKHRLLRRLLR